MPYTIKKVAKLAGISVRTLHYYDQIGLFTPSLKSQADYRLYTDEDLTRLQQILFYRELDFGLAEIKQILGEPGFDRRMALLEQRRQLMARKKRTEDLIKTIDRTLAVMEGEGKMTTEQLFEGFDDTRYREEAEQRWGAERVAESYRRVERLSKEERKALMDESKAIENEMASCMDGSPADARTQAAVARHYQWVSRFWDCSPEAYRGLGQMYVDDPRFTAHYDENRPGLALFMRDSMLIYAGSLERR